jgi:hypothetical protein
MIMNDLDAVLNRIGDIYGATTEAERQVLLRFGLRGIKNAMHSVFGTDIDDAFALHILRNKIVDDSLRNMITTGIQLAGQRDAQAFMDAEHPKHKTWDSDE